MIDAIKISYRIKITEVFYDGFRGVIPNYKSIFNNNVVKDNKYLLEKIFNKNDVVRVTLEYSKRIKEDAIRENHVEFYIAVFQTAVNGIYTKEVKEGEDPQKSSLFYQSRGMITSPALKNNPFEQGDIIKVTLKRL